MNKTLWELAYSIKQIKDTVWTDNNSMTNGGHIPSPFANA